MDFEKYNLLNTYLFECDASIIETGLYDENLHYIILDKTVFYPQGGGQPSDKGIIYNDNVVFNVTKCFIDENNRVMHIGKFETGEFEKNTNVKVKIDEEKRKLHARLHTSAHLIDGALVKLGYSFISVKGYSFPEGPYVEFEGNVEDTNKLISELNEKLKELILSDQKVSAKIEDGLHKGGKPNRIVVIESIDECPCGGSHVQSLKTILQHSEFLIFWNKVKTVFVRFFLMFV